MRYKGPVSYKSSEENSRDLIELIIKCCITYLSGAYGEYQQFSKRVDDRYR